MLQELEIPAFLRRKSSIKVDEIEHSIVAPKKLYMTLADAGITNNTQDKFEKTYIDPQKRINEKVRYLVGEIEGMFDDEIIGKGNMVDGNTIYNFLFAHETTSAIAKKIIDKYKPVLEELQNISNCPQLKEGYRKYTKDMVNNFIQFYTNVIDTCQRFADNTKKMIRIPKKRKIPADKKVAKLKYMNHFPDMQLVSINPVKVVGAYQVWLYNTKWQTLTMINAPKNHTLDIKGQTILNVDEITSVTKRIGRKTEKVLAEILKLPKTQCKKVLDGVSAKPTTLQTRCNDATIILRAF